MSKISKAEKVILINRVKSALSDYFADLPEFEDEKDSISFFAEEFSYLFNTLKCSGNIWRLQVALATVLSQSFCDISNEAELFLPFTSDCIDMWDEIQYRLEKHRPVYVIAGSFDVYGVHSTDKWIRIR